MKVLYKSSGERIQQWSIRSEGATIIIEFGMLHGAMQTVYEHVEINKSGRSLEEQIWSRVNSRIEKQLDKGYAESIEDAKACEGLNAAGLLRPMLAQPIKMCGDVDIKKCLVQYKYNGHRCLISNVNGKLCAYSRNGKPILTIDHILRTLKIPPNVTLDGELYVHGMHLQSIGSLVRRKQEDNKKLVFICYDTMLKTNFSTRLDYLHRFELGPSVVLAPTFRCSDLTSSFEEATRKGYEGLILRTDDTHYEVGKRSYSLIKVKKPMSAEFKVLDVAASKDGWGVLVCEVKPGVAFKVSAPGTIEEKRAILWSKDLYLGNFVTVEFFDWTKDAIPFHPVAINFRSDL